MSLLVNFAAWLGQTPISGLVTAQSWIVPALQVVHIFGVAAVLVAALHIHLRALNLVESDLPFPEVAARYLAVGWIALGALALTGFLLIASEPNRAIFRTVFWVKLALVAAASVTTALQSQIAAKIVAHGGGSSAANGQARARTALAAVSALFWVLAVFAGRWIAYADPWPGAPG